MHSMPSLLDLLTKLLTGVNRSDLLLAGFISCLRESLSFSCIHAMASFCMVNTTGMRSCTALIASLAEVVMNETSCLDDGSGAAL